MLAEPISIRAFDPSMNSLYWKIITAVIFVVTTLGCSASTPDQQAESTKQATTSSDSNKRFTNQEYPEQIANSATIETDLPLLRKLMQVPDSTISAAWQTGEYQTWANDWWLAAFIEITPDAMPDFQHAQTKFESFTLPIEFNFEPPFNMLHQLNRSPDAESARVTFVAETLPTQPFEASPLLNGVAVKIGPSSLFVFLWTM